MMLDEILIRSESPHLTIPQITSAKSENFAVLFEAKALHQSEADDDTRKIKKPRKKLDSCLSCSGNSLFEKNESEFGDLDSRFMSKNEKKFELGLSIDGFHKGDESKNSEANSKIECCNENSVEQIQTLKNKDYDCPICFKVFPSSQAMGGHKRAHYIGILSENKNKESVLAKQEFLNPPTERKKEEKNKKIKNKKKLSKTTSFWRATGMGCKRVQRRIRIPKLELSN
ncbi:Zinc finger protein ZAT9 [Camellia lanceoleosa]|uniref:Zinc finger protein ZAT9 n=1 Tax=Camellia lanceoleosa TaxID=1840588 RepID=A0ACC0I1K8_9ERIC|nr:Zinc finger protein ZAT9 [Camellia lanceoleosa]